MMIRIVNVVVLQLLFLLLIQRGLHSTNRINLVTVSIGDKSVQRLPVFVKNLVNIYQTLERTIIQGVSVTIITTDESLPHITEIIRTWRLNRMELTNTRVVITFDVLRIPDNILGHIDQFPSRHYSGNKAFTKLFIHEILPESMGRVIWLDTDVIIMKDLSGLWKYFDLMMTSTDLIFGVTPNLSNWYKMKNHYIALNNGYNTGVLLMDLNRMRENNFTSDILKRSQKYIHDYGSPHLADQDILNAYFMDCPKAFLEIDCSWNFQLSPSVDFTRSPTSDISILHMNYPDKLVEAYNPKILQWTNFTGLKYVKMFQYLYFKYLDMSIDDMLIDDRGGKMTSLDENGPSNKTFCEPLLASNLEYCSEYSPPHLNDAYRLHPAFIQSDYPTHIERDEQVTLVIQLSFDRVQRLRYLLESWPGFMSIAIYLTDQDVVQFTELIRYYIGSERRKNIGIHLMFKRGKIYPINRLRELALQHVNTRKSLLIDVDFDVSKNLYRRLTAYQREAEDDDRNADNICLIIPAFETQLPSAALPMPDSQADLLEAIGRGQIGEFRAKIWPQGQNASKYNNWYTAKEIYQVSWNHDFEPYMVVETDRLLDVAKMTRAFSGYGWNKVVYAITLDLLGCQFHVMPKVFLLHRPHEASLDMMRFRGNTFFRNLVPPRRQNNQRVNNLGSNQSFI